MRGIRFVAVIGLVALAAWPASAQAVLHGKLMKYNGPYGSYYGYVPQGPGAPFYADCVLRIGDKACVSLYTLDERPPRHQGMGILNKSDARLNIVLAGCEVHNGYQTVVVEDLDEGVAFHNVIDAHDSASVAFTDLDNKKFNVLHGMLPFKTGARLTCRIATAAPAP